MSEQDWEVGALKPPETCAGCQRAFATGDAFVATIALRATGFVREDRCASCTGAVADSIAEWRGVRNTGRGLNSRRLDFESLLDLFIRLDGRADEPSSRLRWIVGLLLMRRRLLAQVGSDTHEGHMVLIVKARHDDRTWRIVDPGLDDAACEAMREDLAKVFQIEPKPAADVRAPGA